jgi:hypothetical protein
MRYLALPVATLLPRKLASKKAAIIEFVKEGKYSNSEIARMVDAEKDYVAKVKCVYRRELENFGQILCRSTNNNDDDDGGCSSSAKPLEPLPAATVAEAEKEEKEQQPLRQVRLSSRKPSPSSTSQLLTTATLLSPEQRKALWTAFDDGKTRVDVVKKFGLDPAIVRREYEVFLEFQGVSLPEVQGKTIRKINQLKEYFIKGPFKDGSSIKDEYEGIVKEYNNRGYLGTGRFLALLEIYWQVARQNGKEFIDDENESPPEGWVRPKCTECGKPLYGILYETT